MTGSPRRESPGVGVGTEEQVGLRDKNVPCRYFSHRIPSCKVLSKIKHMAVLEGMLCYCYERY